MGINLQALKLLLAENEHKKIHGNVLLIGKSTVNIRREVINKTFRKFARTPPALAIQNLDTKHSSTDYSCDDEELYQAISTEIKKVDILDVSAYEGANILHDMNYPIPNKLKGRYDFIYDSSVLDNIFSPSQFIANLHSLLSPAGRAALINVASFFPGAMTSVHPEWMHGFFAANKYHDCKVYLTQQNSQGKNRFEYETDLWLYQPHFTQSQSYDYLNAVQSTNGICHTLSIAEKQESPINLNEEIAYPCNLQYISSSSSADWRLHEFSKSRPLLEASRIETPPPQQPHLTDHYQYLGSGF